MQTEEYKKYREAFNAGLCPSCNAPFISVNMDINYNIQHIYFKCSNGHGHHEVICTESIKIWEMVKTKQQGEGGKRKAIIIKHGRAPSGDPKLKDGVQIYMKVDRKNNKYDQVVTDLNTGNITHEEHESLGDHKNC